MLSVAETSVTIMAASIPILRALARDKAGPKGVKLFTLNATEHVTLQQPEAATDTPEGENGPNKAVGASKRLFTLVRKGRARRAPVLSNIMENEELSPRLLGTTTVERSFV